MVRFPATSQRRCRIDFGAEIDLRIADFASRTDKDKTTETHIVRGSITYQAEHLQMLGLDPGSEAQGTIVWIKPTVTPTDSADAQHQKAAERNAEQPAALRALPESCPEIRLRLARVGSCHSLTCAVAVVSCRL